MNPLHVLGGALALFAVLFGYGYLRPRPNEVEGLRRHYLGLLRMSPAEAQLHLGDQLERLHARFPGKSLGWYLRWLIADLSRAKIPVI